MTVGITYLDGPRLARSLFAAADWVAAGREEINRINVFPVPDGDTGTNFSLTLRSVGDALRALGDASLPETARTAARGAVLGARGNSGMMLAHFLLGFAEAVEQKETASTRDIAAAIRRGADRLYTSLDDPREGTILTVAREAAYAAERAAADSPDIGGFMARMLQEGEVALERTPELLAVLREAGVVDAGGKGFIRMIEGVVRLIEGDPILPASFGPEAVSTAPAALVEVAAERDFQFCTEAMVRGEQLPAANEVRALLRSFGGSIQVVVAGDILKIHVHTDTPEAVFTSAARWGAVQSTKAEDMRAQHRALVHGNRRPVAVVADSSADLSDGILDRHHIALVPLQVMFGDRVYQDRVELKPEEFYRQMRQSKALPTTSQPTPGDFVRVLRDARAEADEVVAVLLASKLSGTFQSAQAAVKAAGLTGVHLMDSASASLGVGLLALRAAELAESDWKAGEIVEELKRVRRQSGTFVTVDRFENLLRSGRVTRGKAWLAGVLDVKPILSIDPQGAIVPIDRVRGSVNLVPRVLALLDRQLTPRPKAIRFGIAHAESPEVAERLRTALTAAYRPRDCFV
ncbi:MAG: DegV family protein, partial [Gemmatimonadales bacterium]